MYEKYTNCIVLPKKEVIFDLFLLPRAVSQKPATPHNLQKWHRTTSATMTDFAHCLAKNHAIKNSIKPQYAPGPCAQYGQAPWHSAKG
jgi:hypothetical protein